MSLQKIEDVKTPQVGKFYLVPCIWHCLTEFTRAFWLPVVGPWHEDAEFVGFPYWHFHYDWRFMQSFLIIDPERPIYNQARVATDKLDINPPKTQLRRRKMMRPMPEFPAIERSGDPVRWIKPLETEFASHVLKCRPCPHRGMSLDGLPIDAQGRVVCNGHGLRWNLNTGRISPRDEL